MPPGIAGLSDDHVHSCAGSWDAQATVLEMCARAVELGLSSICFTEHVDFDGLLPEFGFYKYEHVLPQVEAARDRFADRLEIRMGLEVDFEPRFLPAMLDDLGRFPVDFLLGSVHAWQGKPYTSYVAEGRSRLPVDELAELYRQYFSSVRALIGTGAVDCLGHLDYPAKVGVRAVEDAPIPGYAEELEETLALAVTRNVGLEINTKRSRRGAPLAAPAQAVRRYVELGGAIVTLGSDAHDTAQLGDGLELGAAVLRELDLPGQTVFRGRKPECRAWAE